MIVVFLNLNLYVPIFSGIKKLLGSTDSCTNYKTQRSIKRKNGLTNKNLKIGILKLTSQMRLTPARSNQGESSKSKSSSDLIGVNSVNGQMNQEAFVLPSTIGKYNHKSNLHPGLNQRILCTFQGNHTF